MQSSHPIQIVSSTAAALIFSIAVALASPCHAQPSTEPADEAALQAAARKPFKEKVEPFVKTYCTRCHGGGRAKADVNLEVALKDPGRGVAFLH